MSSETKKNKIIMIMVPPASGHVNPMCGLANELCKNAEVYFYSDDEFRAAIEHTGAQFRRYSHRTFSELPEQLMSTTTNRFCFLLDKMITFSYDLLPQLLADVKTIRPDLILYDCFFVTGKHLMSILNLSSQTTPVPKSIMFFPNFAINEKIGQKFQENAPPSDFWTPFSFLKIFWRQFHFSRAFGLSSYNPIGVFLAKHEHLNLVAVTPELQPFRDEFDSTFKFLGPCISEEARRIEVSSSSNDNELNSFLKSAREQPNTTLVYMSLGTIFNSSMFVFERVAQAVRELEKRYENRRSFKLIMSVGEKNLSAIQESITKSSENKNEQAIRDVNILVRARVPQLEVLKLANVFVTHCGMNSMNEAIKYAVPIVGIPIEGDQPVVAWRACQQLELGIRVDPGELTVEKATDAIDRVLSESKYANNIKELSRVSEKYEGQVEGAKMIMDYIN